MTQSLGELEMTMGVILQRLDVPGKLRKVWRHGATIVKTWLTIWILPNGNTDPSDYAAETARQLIDEISTTLSSTLSAGNSLRNGTTVNCV